MTKHRATTIISNWLAVAVVFVSVFLVALPVIAQPNPEINYQGKLTDSSGVAVADGAYNMRFWLLQSTSQATTSAVWTESLTGSNAVQVTNGLFSVMLGSTSPLTAVDFNQTLYLGVEVGGTGGSPTWDGEMLPRKPLGTVPAAFESFKLGGVASSSFLRSDTADSASGLITFTNGLLSTASSTISGLSFGTATGTVLVINNEQITDFTGTGLINSGGLLSVSSSSLNLTLEGLANVDTTNVQSGNLLQYTGTGWATTSTSSLGIDGSADDLTNNSIEDLSDVTAITENYGDLFYWNGSAWADIATSSLGLGNGTFLGLSDTPSSYTANRIMYTNSGATGLTDSANFVFTGSNLGVGSTTPSATLSVAGNTWLDSNVISYASSSASSLLLQYYTNATSTIKNSSTFAFTIATSTSASPIFRIDTSATYANTYVGGSFTVNDGAIAYNASTNQTTIENLALGTMSFADDAGVVNWTDMGITAGAALGDPMSYTAQLDGDALLTIYGEANGSGGLQNGAVGIGTTTPWARFSVVGDSTDSTKPLFMVASSTGASLLHVTYGGKIGLGTTSPSATLAVSGDTYIGGNLTATGTVTFTNLAGGILTTNSSGVLATTSTSTLFSAGDNWAGTFDGQEGSYYLANSFSTSSANYWETQQTRWGTTSANYWETQQTRWATTSSDYWITTKSVESFSDVAAMTENYGDLFYWNGTAWADIATSSLGLGDGTFLGLSDTPSSYTSSAIPFVSGSALAFDSTFVYDGTSLGIGTAAPGAMLDIYGASNGLRLSYDGSNYSELSVDSSGVLTVNSTGGTGSNLVLGSGLAEDLAFLLDGNAVDWYAGLDDTDDLFKIGIGSEVGTSTLIQISSATTTFSTSIIASSSKFGIGTSSPNAKLSLQNTAFSAAGVAGFDQYLQTANSVDGVTQYGDRFYLDAANTATTTVVGAMYSLKDSTTFGNTVRGLEIQTNLGTNIKGENTALSAYARTFGVRAVTSGDAGDTYEPAAGFFETEGTTQGNAIRGYSDTVTTATLLSLFQASSTFAGTGLKMNFGNTGGSFSSTTSKFIDLQNAGTSVFTVSAYGTTTIGDGSTNHMASLQIGYGGICVDNDGTCTATSTGWVVADGFATGNSDLAEMYFSDTELETGEVVVMTGSISVDRATSDSKLPILGVVSTNPGLTIGSDDTSLIAGEKPYPIALSGRVPVKLSTENGPIMAGDELMLSSLPGTAMKATGTGVTIGVALEDFDDTRFYSDTYLNQFGDSMVEPVYEPIFTEYDPRINDGCYYGGGAAIGDKPCIPLTATTTEGQIKEANDIAEVESIEAQLAELRGMRSRTETLVDGTEVKVGQVIMFVEKSYRWLDNAQVATLGILTSTSSIAVVGGNEKETVFDRLVALANRFVDGVLSVFTLKADKVETKELCVDGVCVGADDLRQLLDGVNQTSVIAPISVEETSEPAVEEVVPEVETIVEVVDETVNVPIEESEVLIEITKTALEPEPNLEAVSVPVETVSDPVQESVI